MNKLARTDFWLARLLTVLLLVPATAQAASWPAKSANQANQNSVVEQPLPPFALVGQVANADISPVSQGNIVVTGSSSKPALVAYQLPGLTKLWATTLPAAASQPVIDSGLIYFGLHGANRVYALELLTGKIRWQVTVASERGFLYSPVVIGDSLLVSGTSTLYRLSKLTGQVSWSKNLVIDSPPATDGAALYLRLHQQRLIKLDPVTGQIIWEYLTGTTWGTQPVVVGDNIYLGTYQKVVAINKASGGERWSYATSPNGPTIGSLAATGQDLLFSASDGTITSLASNGQKNWSITVNPERIGGNGWLSSFIATGDYLLAKIKPTTSALINIKNGQMGWQGALPGGNEPVQGIVEEFLYLTVNNQLLFLSPAGWTLGSLGEPGTRERQPVLLIPGILGSWKVRGSWQFDKPFHIFGDLQSSLREIGYEDSKTLFTLPYDWHKSNQETGELIKAKLSEIRNQTGAAKIDLVSHSMGALAARSYIQGPNYASDVDQLISLAPPTKGSVKAYLTWEAGKVGPTVWDKFLEKLLARETKNRHWGKNIVGYVHDKMPAIRELLPNFDYLVKTNLLLSYLPCSETRYPCNSWLTNLNTAPSKLVERVRPSIVTAQTSSSKTLEKLLVKPSDNPKLWQHGKPIDYPAPTGLVYAPGDNTVLVRSTSLPGVDQYKVTADHQSVISQASCYVVLKLTGQNHCTASSALPQQLLFLSVDPNVELAVGGDEEQFYAPDAELTSLIIIDPARQNYDVTLKAQTATNYDLEASLLGEDFESDQEFTGSLAAGETSIINIDSWPNPSPLPSSQPSIKP